jgi:beta-glucosidase
MSINAEKGVRTPLLSKDSEGEIVYAWTRPRAILKACAILAMLIVVIVVVSGFARNSNQPPPPRFAWGTATAAYQVEGNRNVSERQPSIWDCFDTPMHEANGIECMAIRSSKPNQQPNIYGGENAAIADNDYIEYLKTVGELQTYGFNSYRMSISWPRVISYETTQSTDGIPRGTVNAAGVAHYKTVLSALQAANIDVALTMWHWDTPEALENYAFANPSCTIGGVDSSSTGSFWLCAESSIIFREYAELLLKEFGSYPAYWITLNEPLTIVENGYAGAGPHAPGRCSDRKNCWFGDDTVEPFVVAHNLLRAHAAAFNAWERAVAAAEVRADSTCGIVLSGNYQQPLDAHSSADKAAAGRMMEYMMAIFADPIFLGRWPDSVRIGAGTNLPPLDPSINGTHTGIYFQNYYTTNYAWADQATSPSASAADGYYTTSRVYNSGYHPGTGLPIGLASSNGWLFNYPPGLALMQNWLHERYPTVAFVVTENGWGNASTTDVEAETMDYVRCNYYRSHIGNMSKNAYERGIDVRGFFAWSIMDNYEWADGFSTRFGLTHVDYTTQQRTPKLSMRWFGNVTRMGPPPIGGQDELPPCKV